MRHLCRSLGAGWLLFASLLLAPGCGGDDMEAIDPVTPPLRAIVDEPGLEKPPPLPSIEELEKDLKQQNLENIDTMTPKILEDVLRQLFPPSSDNEEVL